jgi:hypothetical protein
VAQRRGTGIHFTREEHMQESTFDLDQYEDIESAEVAIKDPVTGNSTGMVFILAGPEHDIRRRLRKAEQKRMQRGLERYGKMILRDPEELEQDETDLLVASTLGWQGVASGSKPLEYSREAAQRIYSDPKRRWLRDQVKTALEDRERFIQRSAAT